MAKIAEMIDMDLTISLNRRQTRIPFDELFEDKKGYVLMGLFKGKKRIRLDGLFENKRRIRLDELFEDKKKDTS
jgi:hypothetical protein